LPQTGPTLHRAFNALVDVFNERQVRYAIIGGLAMIQHTRIRTTDDIDALLTLPQIAMPAFFESLKARGFDVEFTKNIRELRDHGLTTIQFEDVIVDLMRPALPVYAHVLDRAVDSRILGHTVRVSAAEGLIVMKLIACRAIDEADIQDLLAAYGGSLDLQYVRAELDSIMELTDPRRVKFESWVGKATGG
jgi:predicted nucleotidyltransferase